MSRSFIICRPCPAICLPYYLLPILKNTTNKSIKAFVDGITAAVIGALAGAVIVIATTSILDVTTALIVLASVFALNYIRKIQKLYI